MFRNRNFNQNRGYGRQNNSRGYNNRGNYNSKPREKELPAYVLNVSKMIRKNYDLRYYTSHCIIKLMKEAGKLKENETVFVDFLPEKYSVTHHEQSTDGQYNPSIREEYFYSTREFYIGAMAACQILANILNNNLSIHNAYKKPDFDMEDTKNLEPDFQSCIDSIVNSEVRRIAKEISESANEDEVKA